MLKPAMKAAALLALVAMLCAERLRALVDLWRHDSLYSMGPLILLASVWLVCRDRRRLAAMPPQPHWLGPLLLVAVPLLIPWLPFTPVILIIALCGIVLTVWGARFLRAVAFPIGFLFFTSPIPTPLVAWADYPLQLFCAHVTEIFAHVAGFRVARQGAAIILPNFHMYVAPECNGLRSAVALLALTVVWTHLIAGKPVFKTVLLAAAVPIAYMCNFLRLFVDVFITNALGQSRFACYEHAYDLLCGFLIFLGSAWTMVQLGALLKCRSIKAIS